MKYFPKSKKDDLKNKEGIYMSTTTNTSGIVWRGNNYTFNKGADENFPSVYFDLIDVSGDFIPRIVVDVFVEGMVYGHKRVIAYPIYGDDCQEPKIVICPESDFEVGELSLLASTEISRKTEISVFESEDGDLVFCANKDAVKGENKFAKLFIVTSEEDGSLRLTVGEQELILHGDENPYANPKWEGFEMQSHLFSDSGGVTFPDKQTMLNSFTKAVANRFGEQNNLLPIYRSKKHIQLNPIGDMVGYIEVPLFDENGHQFGWNTKDFDKIEEFVAFFNR